MRKPSTLNAASGIVLFYPGQLLTDQIKDWAKRHGGCRTLVSFERTLPGIRQWLRRAAFTVIDATEDPAQASDVFLQAVGVQKADAVAVYTEKTHDSVELLVRMLGAPLLMGPMSVEEWEKFLEWKFPSLILLDTAGERAHRGQHETLPSSEESAKDNIVHYKPMAG